MKDLCDIFEKNVISTPGKHYVESSCPGCGSEFQYGEKRYYLTYSLRSKHSACCGSAKKRMIRVCEDCKKEFKYETEG